VARAPVRDGLDVSVRAKGAAELRASDRPCLTLLTVPPLLRYGMPSFRMPSFRPDQPDGVDPMSRGSREISGRALCLLAVFGLFAAAGPGCGDASTKQGDAASPVPSSVQESNKNMENFMMKSQNAAKKK
jgi:hypothetical protein